MTRLWTAVRVFVAVLREIFDEAAYQRFLRSRQIASSAAAYHAFCRERESAYARRTRCC